MSDFYLRGGPGRWSDIFADQQAVGCILVDINAAGRRYCVGTVDVEVPETGTENPLHFVGAILNDPLHKESFDPFSHESSVQTLKFNIMGEHFPIHDLRKSGALLQDINVNVYWHIVGRDYSLEQSYHLIEGKLVEPVFDEVNWISRFSVEDDRLSGKMSFPPVVATTDRIAGLLSEHSGKPYPIIIGTVTKLPLLDISGGGFNLFLVMHDKANEWPTSLPPTQVGTIYDVDDFNPPTELAESQGTDADGNNYLRVTTTAATNTRDITANITGHLPATPGEAVRFLLTMFGDDSNIFDFSSISRLDSVMGCITVGLVFNKRINGGVLSAIKNRLSSLLPFSMIQRGSKYTFEPFTWDRNVVKQLRTGINILKKNTRPVETRRSKIRNSFVVSFGKNGYREGHNFCITADESTNDSCRLSVERYGKMPSMDVDAGDLADSTGAGWLLNWLIETYSKVRTFVSYRCSLDVVNVSLIDTVMVVDEYEGWTETLFKVIGIRRGTGPWIDLDLVSVDDYTDICGVNR